MSGRGDGDRAAAPRAAEETVEVNGVALFTWTVGEGPDVVVLHGGPGAHHDYLLPPFDALAVRRRLRYYDQRGGGRSPVERDVPVGWRQHVSDLDALLDHWDSAPATLLGYSWGALLALLYAVTHTARVGRLALVSPAGVTVEHRRRFEERFAERMQDPRIREARVQLRDSDLRERDPEAYRQRAFELSVAGYFKDPGRARDLTPFRITGRTQQEVWESLGDFDLTEDLRGLSLPALVMHGRHDPMPLECAEHAARALDAPLEVFEDSGHVPYVEEFDRFVQVLDGFLPRAA